MSLSYWKVTESGNTRYNEILVGVCVQDSFVDICCLGFQALQQKADVFVLVRYLILFALTNPTLKIVDSHDSAKSAIEVYVDARCLEIFSLPKHCH